MKMDAVWDIILKPFPEKVRQIIRIIASKIWEMIEEWAQANAEMGETKPASEDKANEFRELMTRHSPVSLSDEALESILALTHETKTTGKGKYKSEVGKASKS